MGAPSFKASFSVAGDFPRAMAPTFTDAEITDAARHAALILQAASAHRSSGGHSLGMLAENAPEILQNLSRGRRGADAKISASYIKTLKQLVELHRILDQQGIALPTFVSHFQPGLGPLPVPQTATVAPSALVPYINSQAPPLPTLPVSFWAWSRIQPMLTRGRWIFLIYLPAILLSCMMGIGTLSLGHLLCNPERIVDLLFDMLGSVPRAGGSILSRMSRSAFDRMFGFGGTEKPPKMPQSYPAIAMSEHEVNRFVWLLLALIAVGWYFSAPPARPAA